jgi:hypothetical protein
MQYTIQYVDQKVDRAAIAQSARSWSIARLRSSSLSSSGMSRDHHALAFASHTWIIAIEGQRQAHCPKARTIAPKRAGSLKRQYSKMASSSRRRAEVKRGCTFLPLQAPLSGRAKHPAHLVDWCLRTVCLCRNDRGIWPEKVGYYV